MTRSPATHPPVDESTDRWAQRGWLLSAIWLVFLGYTITALLEAGLGPGPTTLGFLLIALFVTVYLVAFIGGNRLDPDAPWARFNTPGFVILGAIILAMGTLIGLDALFMTPFLIGYACFLLPRPAAWAVGAGCVGLTFALPALTGDVWAYVFIAAIQVGIFVLNMVTFALIEAGNRSERMQADLAVVSERERLARDVHDILGHTLTVVAVKAELAERLIEGDPERSRAEIAEIRSLVRGALADVRATVGGLRGNDLCTQLEALEVTLGGAGISVEVEGEPATQVPARLRDPLGWLVREAGTNVLRHARASRCLIRFTPGSLVIEDDGIGLGSSRPGNGMLGMDERMAEAGAQFACGTAALGGTRVEACW
ncbi:MAG TPA: histidine kinase [Arthrobacter sp.]|nr:histidine kinase [Arthrobacter sp.]